MGAHESKNKESESNKPPRPPGRTKPPDDWQRQWAELQSKNECLQEQMGIYINEMHIWEYKADKYYCRMNEAYQENYLLKQENDDLREKISDQVRMLCAY